MCVVFSGLFLQPLITPVCVWNVETVISAMQLWDYICEYQSERHCCNQNNSTSRFCQASLCHNCIWYVGIHPDTLSNLNLGWNLDLGWIVMIILLLISPCSVLETRFLRGSCYYCLLSPPGLTSVLLSTSHLLGVPEQPPCYQNATHSSEIASRHRHFLPGTALVYCRRQEITF